jgi:hypothetical protein
LLVHVLLTEQQDISHRLLVIIEVKYVLAIGYDQEREEFVIRLYKENKSIREIAKLNYRYRPKHALFLTGT